MSPFMITCLWCVLQVSLLGAVGVVLSMLVSRRHAASSATVMSATAAVILVATVFAPIQIPSWSYSVEQATQSAVDTTSPNVKADGVELTDKNRNGALVDIGALLANIYTVAAPVRSIVEKPSLVARCFTIVFALGIAIGLARLASAFLIVGRIRRSSELIQGKDVDRELKALAESMCYRWSVRVAESSKVDSAAVIGWLRPLIVLPRDWESWSVEQLRAVLAHELAHIVRRDYLWRAVGVIARAVHFYHPLAHWLLGRLTVSQEIAADQLAAQTLGSRSRYLKALSRLALRQDDRLHREPVLMPTSSSHLMRRIEMLRTKERTQNRGLSVVIRAIAVGAVMLLAVATTALRGLAEPKENSVTNAATSTESAQKTTDGMFNYPPIDPAVIGDNEQGVFLFRVAELLKQDSIKPMVGKLNEALSVACQNWFGSSELVEIDLRTVDYIAGQANVIIRRMQPDPEREHNSQLQLGSRLWVVRFKQDISNWKEWIRSKAPEAKELQRGDITYFQFPPIPAMGPYGIQVAARDSHTLVFSGDSEEFWAQVEANHTVPARWVDEWEKLDGGLFSAITTDSSIEVSIEESKSAKEHAINDAVDNVKQIGFGFDWNPQSDQVAIKMNSCCENQEKAGKVKAAIELARSLGRVSAKTDYEKYALDDPESSGAKAWKLVSEVLDNFETDTTTKPDGTVVVHAETSFGLPFAEFLQREYFSQEEEKIEEVASREQNESAQK